MKKLAQSNKKKKKRARRKGEFICDCTAYKFPHRFSGGKCNGNFIVEETWNKNYGLCGSCENCNLVNKTDSVPYCEVLEGQEPENECPDWQEFVEFNEIIIYEKRKKRVHS